MKLKEYLSSKRMTVKSFADTLGVSEGAVSKWVSGERFPRPVMLGLIYQLTEGQVTANDFTRQQISGKKNQS